MNNDLNMKLEKIAMDIAMEHNKMAYAIPVKTKYGFESVVINSIKIIVKLPALNRIKRKLNVKYGKEKTAQIINKPGGPRYSLNDVKDILSKVPTNVEFSPRRKAQQENLGITKSDAIDILKSLQPTEFKTKSEKTGSQTADVYKAVRDICGEDIELYIKFYIKNKVGIFVISFHESD